MSKLYSEQFKADAVALVESGISRRQVCVDLGVSRSSLQKWITDARLKARGMSLSSDSEVAKEMSAALKRIVNWRWKTKFYVPQQPIFPRGCFAQKDLSDRGKTNRSGKGNIDGRGSGVGGFLVKRFTNGWLSRSRIGICKKRISFGKIRQIHDDDPEFGCRFIADELRAQGIVISERRVWWLCSKAGIISVISQRKQRGKKAEPPVHDDLLQWHFHADEINVAWVTDITEHWTREGKLYLCAIKDLCSRRIVGYATSSRMKSRLAIAALDDAMTKRGKPKGVIVHSDCDS